MSLARTKETLLESLRDPSNKVIALSGKWGTGKTYLWGEVQMASTDQAVKDAISVSIFGANSIADLKIKIAQKVIPTLRERGKLAETVTAGYAAIKKVLRGIHSGFSALDELSLVVAPLLLKGRFIVIDDVERKHESLSIDEILGFIDDCVQTLECRILLILNSDQLGDKRIWDLFREKVIDQELRLETTPSEAFAIAMELTPTRFAEDVRKAAETCRIDNIRILRKVIRVVNRLLADKHGLSASVIARVVPSMTLMSAIHYKGLEDGPDFDFVLSYEDIRSEIRALVAQKNGGNDTPESKKSARWRLLLDKLGIRGADEFEALVADFLKSGLIDALALDRVINRYVAEAEALEARERAYAFLDRATWHPEVDHTQLIDELHSLIPVASMLDMFTVTSLHSAASKLDARGSVGEELIHAWLSAFKAKHVEGKEPTLDPGYAHVRRDLHPSILAEIHAIQDRQQMSLTVLEVFRRVAEESGWGSRDEAFMRSTTAAQIEEAIRVASGRDLRVLLLQGMEFIRNRATYEKHFGSGVQGFLDACKSICAQEPDSRLSGILHQLFVDAGMGERLGADVAIDAASSNSNYDGSEVR